MSKKTKIYAHSAFRYVEVHRVTSRRDDGGVFETEFIGFASRHRPTQENEVVAPLSHAALATITAAADEGIELELID